MPQWSLDTIPDLTGKTAVVTGANMGYPFESAYNCTDPTHINTSIGYETALELARHGCKVILACRDATRAENSKAAMLKAIRAEGIEIADENIQFEPIDLASFKSVQNFADRIKEKYPSLSLLINNAGTNARPYSTTEEDHHETIFQTNYLGHVLLTRELLPLLAAEKGARIVTQTSYWHHQGEINFNHLEHNANDYDYTKAYANSKLAELMFSKELDRRLKEAGSDVLSVATHPGSGKTTMLYRYDLPGTFQYLSQNVTLFFQKLGESIVGQSPKEAALTELYACTSDDVEGGMLYGPDGWKEITGNPTRVLPADAANNEEVAKNLFDRTDAMLPGKKFDFASLRTQQYRQAC